MSEQNPEDAPETGAEKPETADGGADATARSESAHEASEDPMAASGADSGDEKQDRFTRELRQAREHFAGIHVGATEDHTTPLSRQMEQDIARLFPIDEEYFVQGRRTQLVAVWGYALLRLITLCLFTVMTTLQFAVFVGLHDGATGVLAWLSGLLAFTGADQSLVRAALTIGGIGVVFWIGRWIARWRAFEILERRAERLSYRVFGRLDDIKARITETAAKTRERAGGGGVANWPKRARDWTIIALWCAKRAEYLDRFITIVIWTVRTRITQMERGLLGVKLALVLALAVTAAFSVPEFSISLILAVTGFTALIILQTVGAWHWAGMKPNDFWTKEFRAHAPSEESSYETYVDRISGIVLNLVDEVIAKEWGQGGGKGG